jgi:predicted transposase YbfD/YdcC
MRMAIYAYDCVKKTAGLSHLERCKIKTPKRSQMKTSEIIAKELKLSITKLEDPRNGPAQLHKFEDIIIIAICAILSGADHWTEVAEYGKAKAEWLGKYLELAHGIPSHDTFSRVFRHLNPEAFARVFSEWTQQLQKRTAWEVIAIDGKCVRGSYDQQTDKAAIYIVSAWADQNGIVLGQRKVDDKSNEITAIPELLDMLDVKDCIVSIDAMGTQKTIAAKIIDKGGDYLLALKNNQKHLREDVASLFTWADNMQYEDMEYTYAQTTNKGHGRIEIRECWALTDPQCLAMLSDIAEWKALNAVARVRYQRKIGDTSTTEERFYISSMGSNTDHLAKRMLKAVRSHWGIENRLHWVLDMAFREDECRVRKGHGDENLAILRHTALNLLRTDKKTKLGIHGKRLRAGWDHSYLASLLGLQMR